MKLVVEIDEVTYKDIKKGKVYSSFRDVPQESVLAIANGTPLPKGHGALKDFEKIYADISEKEELARQRVIDTPTSSPCYMRYVAQLNERTAFKEMLYDAPTIIEKAESEGKK